MTDRMNIDGLDISSLVDEATFEETYDGASTHAPGPMEGSPLVEDDPVGVTNAATGADVVTLRNIRSPEQAFGIHDEQGRYTGRMVRFVEGVLITDRETANRIKAEAPHVYEEPTEGEVHKHPITGWATRHPMAFAEYNIRYGQSQV